jgi:hypothetical protein
MTGIPKNKIYEEYLNSHIKEDNKEWNLHVYWLTVLKILKL